MALNTCMAFCATQRAKHGERRFKRFSLGPRCLIKTKESLFHWPRPTMQPRVLDGFCSPSHRHVDRLTSHIAFGLSSSNSLFGVDDLQVRCRTILAFQINYNKEGIGETLCWSWKGGERSMHKINIFRFDSSVNFAEILPPSFFFCLGCFFHFSGRTRPSIHLGSADR